VKQVLDAEQSARLLFRLEPLGLLRLLRLTLLDGVLLVGVFFSAPGGLEALGLRLHLRREQRLHRSLVALLLELLLLHELAARNQLLLPPPLVVDPAHKLLDVHRLILARDVLEDHRDDRPDAVVPELIGLRT